MRDSFAMLCIMLWLMLSRYYAVGKGLPSMQLPLCTRCLFKALCFICAYSGTDADTFELAAPSSCGPDDHGSSRHCGWARRKRCLRLGRHDAAHVREPAWPRGHCASAHRQGRASRGGTQFTCFTGTKVRILTQTALLGRQGRSNATVVGEPQK